MDIGANVAGRLVDNFSGFELPSTTCRIADASDGQPTSFSMSTCSDSTVPQFDFVKSCLYYQHDSSSALKLSRRVTNNESRLVEIDSCECESDLSFFRFNSVISPVIDADYLNDVADYHVVSTLTDISCVTERDVSEVLLSPLVFEEPVIAKMCRSFLNEIGLQNNLISRFNEKLVEAVHKIITEFKTGGLLSTQVCSSRKHSHFSLIEAKTNGGLLYPSDDVVLLCEASEKCFRAHMGPTDQPNLCNNLRSSLVSEVLAQFIGKDIFGVLMDHSLESDALNDHRIILMKKVVQSFMTIILYHQGKSFTRSLHPQTCRSTLNKTVIFKGQ